MKLYQYLLVVLILAFTIWFSWHVQGLLNFAYVDYNETDSYAVINTLKYLRFFPTMLLFVISGFYALVMMVVFKLIFRKLSLKTIAQLSSFIFLVVFLNGIAGSYEGIREYQVNKCNTDIQRCLKEEEAQY